MAESCRISTYPSANFKITLLLCDFFYVTEHQLFDTISAAFIVWPSIELLKQGKPIERWGRKVTGLQGALFAIPTTAGPPDCPVFDIRSLYPDISRGHSIIDCFDVSPRASVRVPLSLPLTLSRSGNFSGVIGKKSCVRRKQQ